MERAIDRARLRRVALHLTALLLSVCACADAGLHAAGRTSAPQPAVLQVNQTLIGGEDVPELEWESVGWLDVGCTSVLIAERVLVYAAHCGEDAHTVWFGNSISTKGNQTLTPPSVGVAISRCEAHPDADFLGRDLAVCILAASRRVPMDPLVSERVRERLTVGDEVLLIGYGDLRSGARKLTKTATWAPIQEMGVELVIGNSTHGSCPGDSGGPAFVAIDDGFELLGILSGGEPETCGAGWYTDLEQVKPWLSDQMQAAASSESPAASCAVRPRFFSWVDREAVGLLALLLALVIKRTVPK